jgi:hypothetical protein
LRQHLETPIYVPRNIKRLYFSIYFQPATNPVYLAYVAPATIPIQEVSFYMPLSYFKYFPNCGVNRWTEQKPKYPPHPILSMTPVPLSVVTETKKFRSIWRDIFFNGTVKEKASPTARLVTHNFSEKSLFLP